jgi:hypothetical protein
MTTSVAVVMCRFADREATRPALRTPDALQRALRHPDLARSARHKVPHFAATRPHRTAVSDLLTAQSPERP